MDGWTVFVDMDGWMCIVYVWMGAWVGCVCCGDGWMDGWLRACNGYGCVNGCVCVVDV